MILVDTGYLIALTDPVDSLHQRTLAWSATVRVPLLVTEYVLLETVNHFSAPMNRRRVHVVLQNVRSAADIWQVISASPALFKAGVQLHAAREDKEWTLTDCISFVVMGARNLTRALAYDHHFEQAGFEPLLRREPTG